MTVVYVDTEDFPKKIGKFPDYITKGLKKPSFIGGKIRGAYQLGKVLYKAGALRKVGRYYGYKYRIPIAGIGGGIIAGSLWSTPDSQNQQGRTNMVKSRAKRKYYNRCRPRRGNKRPYY